ncbi:type II secretion system F family protein [Candidatus Micrarchaeota archaeon]|nr:type II secretion system F family protein [Candidatus Micrarchaeota archaeon]
MIEESLRLAWKRRLDSLGRSLRQLGWKQKPETLTAVGAGGSALLCAALAAFVPKFPALVVLASTPLIAALYVPRVLAARRTATMESQLVASLYAASAEASFSSPEDLVESLASGRGELSEELQKCHAEITNGETFEGALKRLAQRNDSKLLSRFCSMMMVGYRTGCDMSKVLSSLADDASMTLQATRERASAILVEKYTVIASACLVLPVMLGSVISLSSSIASPDNSILRFGADEDTRKALFGAAVLGSGLYAALFSIIAAVFVAVQDGRKENAIIYLLLFLPVSLSILTLVSSAQLF